MKLLNNFPEEKYDDYKYCLRYLRDNKTIGDEPNVDYNGIFHVHWRGPIDNDKVILHIKSILATQEVSKIYFWIENNLITFTSPSYSKLVQFGKYVEIKIFNKEIFDLAIGEQKNKEKIWFIYSQHHQDRRYKTDILRWVILSIYGGIYTDADTLLLRDLREIRLNNWSNSWATFKISQCAEGCAIKLAKGSDVYEQMYLNNPNNPQCYLLIDKTSCPQAYLYKYENLRFTCLPSPFFDIMWTADEREVDGISFYGDFGIFFKETNRDTNLDNFMKGCFAYHWHNFWTAPELRKSYAGKLNEDIDKKIKEKYNINPIKIFQT
jgi:hypothetical protein